MGLSMVFFSNLKLRGKLVILLAVPIACLLYFVGVTIQRDGKEADRLEQMHEAILLSVKLGHFLEESQRERGMSGLYLISHGTHFKKELALQRIETDKRLTDLRQLVKANHIQDSQLLKKLYEMLNFAYRIRQVRNNIDHFKISASDLGNYYSEMNEDLLDTVSIARDLNTNAITYPLLRAYYDVLLITEDIGQQRRYLTLAFYENKITKHDFDHVVYWVGCETRHLEVFHKVASTSAQKFYDKLSELSVYQKRKDIREAFFEKGMHGPYNQDPETWFFVSSQWMNTLTALENKVSNDLISNSLQQRDIYLDDYYGSIFVALLDLFLTALIALYLTNSISKPLSQCVEFTKKVASGDLTVTMDLNRNDEIGELSQAMSRMVLNLKKMTEDLKENALFVAYASRELSDTVEVMRSNPSPEKVLHSATEFDVDINNLHQFLMKLVSVSSNSERMTREVKKIVHSVEEIAALLNEMNVSKKLILSKLPLQPSVSVEPEKPLSGTSNSSDVSSSKEAVSLGNDVPAEQASLSISTPPKMPWMTPSPKHLDHNAVSDKLSKTACQLSEMADNIEKMIQTFKV